MREKWNRALEIVRNNSINSAIFFTGDKESTLLLELRKGLDIPVIFVDTGFYPEEIYRYLEVAEKHWGFKATVLIDKKVIENSSAKGKEECYNLLVSEIIMPSLLDKGVYTLIEPLKESKSVGKIKRVFPLIGFTDLEVWRLIREGNIPYCDLYNKGFRDVGCEPCSTAGRGEDTDQEEVKRRLKALGYL